MSLTLIGIAGKIGSGKDAVGSILAERYPDTSMRVAFADALKDEVAENFKVTRQHIDTCKPMFRQMLQAHGQLRRELNGQDYWLARVLHKITIRPKERTIVYITDVRHINEAKAIRDVGGYLWCIQRPSLQMPDKQPHISETALDNWSPWDAIIANVGSLEELKTKVLDELSCIL